MKKVCVIGMIILLVGVNVSGNFVKETKEISTINFNDNTLYVGGSGPDNYTKIQYAIDNASEGDTIYVYSNSSPYFENVNIHTPINLIGENEENTIIDGEGKDYVIRLNTNNTNIFNLKIQNGVYGIKLEYNKNIIISNNKINNNSYQGIGSSEFSHCENITIKYNNLYDNKMSLSLQGFNNIISYNMIKDNQIGVVITGWGYETPNVIPSYKNNIYFNTIILNESKIPSNQSVSSGIWMNYVNSTNISFNTIVANGQQAYGGIYMQDSYNISVFMNNITNCLFCLDIRYVSQDPPAIVNQNSCKSIDKNEASNSIIKNNFNKQILFILFLFDNYFIKSTWQENFWGRPKVLPKIIFGFNRGLGFPFPTHIEFDLHPAKQPYDIPKIAI